jgi:hypothetical protein
MIQMKENLQSIDTYIYLDIFLLDILNINN